MQYLLIQLGNIELVKNFRRKKQEDGGRKDKIPIDALTMNKMNGKFPQQL